MSCTGCFVPDHVMRHDGTSSPAPWPVTSVLPNTHMVGVMLLSSVAAMPPSVVASTSLSLAIALYDGLYA